jgi:hypothetical protein
MRLVTQTKLVKTRQNDQGNGSRKHSKKNGQSAKVLRQSDDELLLFKPREPLIIKSETVSNFAAKESHSRKKSEFNPSTLAKMQKAKLET